VSDLFMSLMHTCELEMKASPTEWMPWNYREMLVRSTMPAA
jgi:hypothetical protein